VLYDLTFLEKKRYWPVPEESGRMKRYASNELLYKARHDAVFGNWWKLLRDDKKASLEIIINFPRRLTNLWGDLLMGEAPVYSKPGSRRRPGGRQNGRVPEMAQVGTPGLAVRARG